MTHIQYNFITSKILNLFPNESSSTYYISSVSKNSSPTGKPILAKGKLIDKCRNMLYKSSDKCYVRKRKKKKEKTAESNKQIFFSEGILIKNVINKKLNDYIWSINVKLKVKLIIASIIKRKKNIKCF